MSAPLTHRNATDDALRPVFGGTERELAEARKQKAPFPNVYFNTIVGLIERSQALDHLQEWADGQRKSAAGRPSFMSPLTVLTVFTMNALWSEGYTFRSFTDTLYYRLTPEQRERIGIRWDGADWDSWYTRFWRASERLRDLISPWRESAPLNCYLTGEQYQNAVDGYDEDYEARAHLISDLLVQASIVLIPKRYLENYEGDIALDSTQLPVRGITNPYPKKKGDPFRKRTNVDHQCGSYTRKDDHDGRWSKDSNPAYELTTVVPVLVREGAFPIHMVTAARLHLPGRIKDQPREAVTQHAKIFPQRGIVVADRAFNNLKPENFQEPLRRLGYEASYKFRDDQLGVHGSVPGTKIVILAGSPYLNLMPHEVRDILELHAKKKQNPATGKPYTDAERDEILKLREPYRLKRKGIIEPDGKQRFIYPDPSGYRAYDPINGRPTKKGPTGTIRFGLEPETIKHLQLHPYRSKAWFRAQGERNKVEMLNSLLKLHNGADLGNPAARTGRGFAYTYLCAIAGVVATNLIRIGQGIKDLIALGMVTVDRPSPDQISDPSVAVTPLNTPENHSGPPTDA